ncbi:MAG: hypothetical protein ACYCU7_01320 [Acidimicrobiales bacterium]
MVVAGLGVGIPGSGAIAPSGSAAATTSVVCDAGATGYWLVASDGGVFAFGGAGYYGSAATEKLDAPIVGLVPTSDGKGYWLIGADGGVFAYGDAVFGGSMAGTALRGPVVGGAAAAPACTGAAANTILSGPGVPSATLGSDGDLYLDTASSTLYGPKGGGNWPSSGTELVGAAGPAGATGLTGPAGPAGPSGPPVTFEGTWSSTAAYAVGDAVAYQGSSYVALGASTGAQPSSNPAEWALLAAQGATGSQGPTGGQGPQGSTGPPASFLGTWSSTATYTVGDAVAYQGSSYVALADNVNVDPALDVSSGGHNWALLAAEGATGPAGPAGGLATYGDLYLPAGTVSVGAGQAVVDLTSQIVTSGLAYDPSTGALTVASSGDYRIDYRIATTSAASFGVDVDGTAAPACAAVETGAGSAGSCILSLSAGDALTVVNTSSSAATVAASAPANSASVAVEMLS